MGPGVFLKEIAWEEGFQAIGFARAEMVPGEKLKKWLQLGYQGEMDWMAGSAEKRLDPASLLEGALTVVSLLYPYPHSPDEAVGDPTRGLIASYALGRDYHLVLGKKLKRISRALQQAYPGVGAKYYVDAGPVSETYWAWKAGLGWIGKNSLLITPEFGSWFFLAELIIDYPLEPGIPLPSQCGSCTACLDACPTRAIVEPGVVDARKCISYLTIEHRSEIPDVLARKMGNRIFGCDICQEVCPWNRGVAKIDDPLLAPVSRDYSLEYLLDLEEDEFRELFRQSPLKRTGLGGLKRNVAVAMKNRKF